VVIGLGALVSLADLGHVRFDLRPQGAQAREPGGALISPERR
jgi:hypothetical protein